MAKSGPKRHSEVCHAPGCTNRRIYQHYCQRHYDRFKRFGTIENMRRENGTGSLNKSGYLVLGKNWGKALEHILIAESSLGYKLPKKAQVHHFDGNPKNNSPSNLVICPDQNYHLLLHRRMRAYEACGNADFVKCYFCKEYDDPNNMYIRPNGKYGIHRECRNKFLSKKNK